jgi:hypothetical protein
VKMEREKREKMKMERAMTHRVAMIFGASQPTLALGRQTSNCHVGQDVRRDLLPTLPDYFLRKRLVYSGS